MKNIPYIIYTFLCMWFFCACSKSAKEEIQPNTPGHLEICGKKPDLLQQGNQVAILAPQFITFSKLNQVQTMFTAMGLAVTVEKGEASGCTQGSPTNDKVAALKDLLQKALDNERSKAIVLCSEHNTLLEEIIDDVDFSKFQSHPKWIVSVGTTCCTSKLYNQGEWESVAVGPSKLTEEATKQNLQKLLMTGESVVFQHPTTTDAQITDPVSGEVIGGDIAVVQSSIGTPTDGLSAAKGKIVYLTGGEQEAAYALDRQQSQIHRTSRLANARALVTCMQPNTTGRLSFLNADGQKITQKNFQSCSWPIVYNFPIGVLPYGRQATLSKTQEGNAQLVFEAQAQ